MKHRHVWKFSKTPVFGLLCFTLSAQFVFAAPPPPPPPSPSFFDLLRSAGNDLSENLSLITATINKYTPSPASLLTRIRDNFEVVFTSSHLAQVSTILANPSSSTPQATSTPASLPPTATSTTPLSFSYVPPAGTRTPSPVPQAYAVSASSLASLREDLIQEIARTRADLQANIFTSRQSSPVPGVSFAQSFQAVAPTLLSNLNNLHAGGDFTVENGNIHILSPNTGLTITSGTITVNSGSATIPTLTSGNITASTITSNTSFTVGSSTNQFLVDQYGNTSVGTVGGFSDTPVKLTNPASLPTNAVRKPSFSPDGTYLAVSHISSPYVTIYKRSGDTFTKLADPAILPTGHPLGSSFSPDGTYLVIGHQTSPYVTIYKRSGDTFTKLADPAILPTGQGNSVSLSPDGTYLSIGLGVYPYVNIYKRSGDTFTKLADPASLPAGQAQINGNSFSPDGTYLAIGHSNSPYVTIYKRSGDTFTKLADPASLPTGQGHGVSFSRDGTYLTVTHESSPNVTIYKRSGDTFTKLADPASLPTGQGNDASFSPDGTYLAVSHSTSPYITIYKRSGDTFTKLADPANLPAGTGAGVSFSPDGTYLAIGHSTSPYITIYKGSGSAVHKLELALHTTADGGIGIGKEISLYRSAPNMLSLSSGNNLNIDSGALLMGGISTSTTTTVIDASFAGYFSKIALGTSTVTANSRLTVWGTGTSTNPLADFVNGNSANLMTILENGNVGIGTAQPSSTLHLLGTNSSTISLANTLSGGKRYDFRVGAITSGTLDIYDFTSSTSRFFVGADGNVGIGTTQPSSTLHVAGTLTVSSCVGCTSTSTVTAIGTAGYFPAFTATSTLSATSSLYWDSANLRIGLGTAQPSSTLHVVGLQTSSTYALEVMGGIRYTGPIVQYGSLGQGKNNLITSVISSGKKERYAGNNGLGQSRPAYYSIDQSAAITGTRDSATQFTRASGEWVTSALVGQYAFSYVAASPNVGAWLPITANTTTTVTVSGTITASADTVKTSPWNPITNTYAHGQGAAAFSGGVFDGESIWLAPRSSSANLVKVNPATGAMTTYAHGQGTSAFVGGVFDGESIWLVPSGSANLVKVNPATGAMTTYAHGQGTSAFAGGVFDGESVWLVPRSSANLVKVNPATGAMTTYAHSQGTSAFVGGVFDGESIWLVPRSSANLVKVNPATGAMTTYAHGQGTGAFYGGVFDGESVWLVPRSSANLVRVRPPRFGREAVNTAGTLTVSATTTLAGTVSFPGSGAWTSSGLVGIGTAQPSSTLHISGANSSTISISSTQTGGKRYDFRVGAITSGTLDIYDFTSSTSRFFVSENGNIGMGTSQPSSTLHVAGALTVSSCTGCASASTVTATGTAGYFPAFTATSTLSATSSLYWDSANLRIGIGTAQPSSTFHLVSTSTNQFRLGYDRSGYSTLGVASDGALTLTTNGSGANFNVNLSGSGNINVNNGALYFNSANKSLSVNNSASLAQFEVDVPTAAAANQIPTMTGYTTPSGVAAASSEYGGTASAWQAFDYGTGPTDADFFGHSWGSSVTTFPHWLSYQFTISKTIVKYRLYATEYPTYAPKDWTFEGWDGSSWVVLDTRINQINNWATYNEYTFTNTTAYIKYRLNISGSNSGTGYVAVDEFQMFEGTSYTPAFSVATNGNASLIGNMGIFTTQPSSTLHIATSTPTISLASTLTGGKRFDFRVGSVASGTLDLYDFASSTSRLTITQEGWVGINTPFPPSPHPPST